MLSFKKWMLLGTVVLCSALVIDPAWGIGRGGGGGGRGGAGRAGGAAGAAAPAGAPNAAPALEYKSGFSCVAKP